MANLILHKRMSIAQYNTFKTLHTVNGVLDDEFKNTLFVLNETGTFTGTDDCIFYMGEHLISYASYKKALSLSSSSTDNQFPTAKCVYDAVKNKADSATTLSGYGITDAYTKTEVDSKLTTVYKAAGSAATVSALGSLDAQHEGFVYNMSAEFETTSNFVEGAGKSYPVGTNVVIVNTGTNQSPVYKYDILAGETQKLSVNITWQDLKTLRDNSSLVPGQQYRITDYTCTTTQTNTQSAGHVFDIIVTADDVNVLNENARAARHSGDTYFQDCKLESWELKYSLDNDTTRFAWADDTNGKGVVFYMKDEWNNECPYDFKNMLFKRYRIDTCQNSPDLEGLFGIDNSQWYTVDTSTTYWCYTFCMIDTSDNAPHDVSIEQNVYVSDEGFCYHNYNNVIKAYHDADLGADPVVLKMFVPDNVFVTDTDICAIEEGYGKFFGFHTNTLGRYCCNNTFGNGCSSNTLGNGCYNNTLGNNCGSNTFGNGCNSNTLGNGCYNNTLGNNCYNNTFGNGCYNNTFGNGCYNNTFGNDCYSNTFGNSCKYIKFGDSSNTKNYYRYNIVENGNQYINLSCTATTSDSQYYQNVTIAQGTNNTTTYKTITDSNVGQIFKTTYQPANSQIISI